MRTWKELDNITGGLSNPSKMPCAAWSIPARHCKVGGKLATVEGSVCFGCYALKGRYVFPTTQTALDRRLEAFNRDHQDWVDGMAESIAKVGNPYFRWFDSGDLQSLEMLRAIVAVAERTPDVEHWLPTRERNVVTTFLRNGGVIPTNLVIRLSATMVGQTASPATEGVLAGVPVSTVGVGEGHGCPAPEQGNHCGPCRACWDQAVLVVDYHEH